MIKRVLAALVLLGALGLFLAVDPHLRQKSLDYSLSFKEWLLSVGDGVREWFGGLTAKAERIEELERQVGELMRYKLLFGECERELKKADEILQAAFDPQDFHLLVARMISFVRMGDYTSAWLSAKVRPGRVYGLITQKGAAGLAVERQGRAMALFNGNKECSYTVTIDRDILGIATGSGDNRYLLVRYIPSFAQVKKGQKVITNGFDAIFPYGVEVGEVESVWLEGSYQVAKVRTYEDLADPLFFWLVWREANGDIN